jgi:hypothetical protein
MNETKITIQRTTGKAKKKRDEAPRKVKTIAKNGSYQIGAGYKMNTNKQIGT